MAQLWQDHRGALPGIGKLTDSRKRKMKARWKEEPSEAYWLKTITKLASSSFVLQGTWCSFDWLIANDANHLKASQGNYDDKPKLQAVDGGKRDWKKIFGEEWPK